MDDAQIPPAYHTYLLTIWEERAGQSGINVTWRYRLEDPHSGKKYLFATLIEMVQFLEQMYHSSKA